jgi:FO synthase subunit 1
VPARQRAEAGGVQALDSGPFRLITYSRNVFIPVSNLCRNRCGYCAFRRDLSQAKIIGRTEALHLLERAKRQCCTEALFSMGESPWEVPGFKSLTASAGISDLMDYLVELCELALEHGLLPHTNAGLLSDDDLLRLAPYNASMGLMLETLADVAAHHGSPGKSPARRLSFIERTGMLKVPFTTGILVGIGESWNDRIDSLKTIANLHRTHGHIQEVIIQPLDPKPGTFMSSSARPSIGELQEVVRLARRLLPGDVAVQVPPNLVDPLPLVEAGANDLGGLSSVTPDWINPDRHWPKIDDLRSILKGYDLVERLPIYPRYVLQGWCGWRTRPLIKRLAGRDGLLRKDYLRCGEVGVS